ncbi:hypothetical protein NoPa_00115 [Pseudomonas phage vB_PpuM-NoPa]|uniref:Uncharacterized protein n=1 Tax=Pseudomonas phage vB_PpuM-NoPa TaxID=3132619 RepID=A0AAX4MYI7_9CAUD
MLPHCTVQKHESVSFQLLIHSMLRIRECRNKKAPTLLFVGAVTFKATLYCVMGSLSIPFTQASRCGFSCTLSECTS